MTAPTTAGPRSEVTVRSMHAGDAPLADIVMRRAFGTFLGLAEPATFMGDASFVVPRARGLAEGAWVAERDGEIVGSVFATRWGSFGFFGPLSVRPDLWDAGIGRRLMEPVEAAFTSWGVEHAGLFTWPHSPKHLALYQRYGYWPHALTLVMARPVREAAGRSEPDLLSVAGPRRGDILSGIRRTADSVLSGLDLTKEAEATVDLGLGDVVIVDGGFAICQHGPGTEAGGGALYVKFGAVTPGPGAGGRFAALLEACDAYAQRSGAEVVLAGVSTARLDAYRALLDRGFRVEIQGLAMHRGGEALWSRRGCWVLDDWR